ncbi:hypothetical protein HYS94_02015 [Candidatus Daviesbacteria bacterium]|nr:hypothetical protein [Candidatus Daviesbacteria bacterium]
MIKEVWETPDRKHFVNKEEAERHDTYLSNLAKLNKFYHLNDDEGDTWYFVKTEG